MGIEMAEEYACDFDQGINGRTREPSICKLPGRYYIRRVDHEGDAKDFIRCREHTETIVKGFANTLFDVLAPRALSVTLVRAEASPV